MLEVILGILGLVIIISIGIYYKKDIFELPTNGNTSDIKNLEKFNNSVLNHK